MQILKGKMFGCGGEGLQRVLTISSNFEDGICLQYNLLNVSTDGGLEHYEPGQPRNLVQYKNGIRKVDEEALNDFQDLLSDRTVQGDGIFQNVIFTMGMILLQENRMAYEELYLGDKVLSETLQTCIYSKKVEGLCNIISLDGDTLEKLIKSLGRDFFRISFAQERIKVDNDKGKLKQMLSVPSSVIAEIRDNFKTELASFQNIVEAGNGNDAIYLINFLKTVYPHEYVKAADVIRKISRIITLKKMAMPVLLTYLYRSQYYNTFLSSHSFNSLESFRNATVTLLDSLVMYKKLTGENMGTLPTDLFFEHSVLAANTESLDNCEKNIEDFQAAVEKYQKYSSKNKKFLIRNPANQEDLIREGGVLRHCVASYIPKIIKEGAIVMLLRKIEEPDVPFVTIEYDVNYGVTQVKTFCDQDVLDTDVLDFIHEWEERLTKI